MSLLLLCRSYHGRTCFVDRGNQYMRLVKVLYCKLPTIGKQLPTFPHKARGLNCPTQRWEVSVLSLHHCGPLFWF